MARAEERLEKLGPGHDDRLKEWIEEASAHAVVLDHIEDQQAAKLYADLVEALANVIDLRHQRSAKQDAAGDSELI